MSLMTIPAAPIERVEDSENMYELSDGTCQFGFKFDYTRQGRIPVLSIKVGSVESLELEFRDSDSRDAAIFWLKDNKDGTISSLIEFLEANNYFRNVYQISLARNYLQTYGQFEN